MKRFYPILGGVLIILLTSCTSRVKEVKDYQTVKIDTVVSANEQTLLQFPGKVKAAQDISLAFRVSGTIRSVYVKDGTPVCKGQLLAELDPTDYQVQLDATEAEYRQIKAEAERVIALYKENGTTPNANDKAVYGLKQITAKYQHHKDQLEYTRLYAPFDGFVQKHLFEEHETVGAGMPVISMISGGMPEIEINLPAAEYIRRGLFNRYHCTFDIYSGKVYQLKFVSVTPKANSNQLYLMRMQFVAGQQPVPSPGMNTMVSIYCDVDNSGYLSVPSSAIIEKDGKAQVFVYNPSGNTVHSCSVSFIRLLSNGRSVISSDTLKPDDLIVSSGAHYLQDGETVKPLPSATKTNIGGLL